SRVGSVLTAVAQRWIGRFHLRERPALIEQVLHAVAHDGNRVPILEEIEFVVHVTVTGDHERAIRVPLYGQVVDAEIHQAIERIELTLYRAPALHVDERKARRVDDVARRDHVAAAEKHDGVAISVRGRLMEYLNALAVEIHRVHPDSEPLCR